jgi:hypothetical protein
MNADPRGIEEKSVKSVIKKVLVFLLFLMLSFPGRAGISARNIEEPTATTPQQAPSATKSGKQTADGVREEQITAKPADAKLLACPAAGGVIELASGNWYLGGDCTANGLTLRGDARIWTDGVSFTVNGDVNLEQNAALHIRGGSFNQANHIMFEYHIHAKGNSLLEFRDVNVLTNAGVVGNLASTYEGADDSRLFIENVQIDTVRNWLLCSLHDRASVDTKNSKGFPSEIYPSDNSTARIEGPQSGHRVWLFFMPGSSATLENLPASQPFSFSFGRNTPGATGIGYQVDIIDGNVDFGVRSFPDSKVTVRNARGNLGVDCQFTDVTSPETLTGLKGGIQSGSFCNQDRVFNIEDAELPPYGWQIYSNNKGIPLASVAPVTITDSLINEIGAFEQGRFEISHVQFAFAVIAAVGAKSRVHVRDSVINSQSIISNNDGVITIEDSEIFGALLQATGRSQIFVLNTTLRTNERNPKCVPLFPPMQGSLPNACNPYNPAREVHFVTTGEGAIWVAGIEPIATPIRAGSTYSIVGDAIFKTTTDVPLTYNLRYRRASASEFTAIVTGATGPKRDQPLGQLDTAGLAPGDYFVELQLIVPSQDPVTVQRSITIIAP